MMTGCRPLVMPGMDATSGLWFPCIRYRTPRGHTAVHVVGGYPTTWDKAAQRAITACQSWESHQRMTRQWEHERIQGAP